MALGTEVGLGSGHIVLGEDPAPLRKKGAEPPPQFSDHFYCAQTAGCIKMPSGMAVGLSPGDFVLDGDPAPSPKRAEPPIFGLCLLRPNGCRDQDATWYGVRPRSRRHCVRWGPSSPPQKGGRTPQFSTHLYCDQTAGCIKMPLGMDVDLSPGDFVLDGDPAILPKKGTETPNIRRMSIAAKRLHGSRCHLLRR